MSHYRQINKHLPTVTCLGYPHPPIIYIRAYTHIILLSSLSVDLRRCCVKHIMLYGNYMKHTRYLMEHLVTGTLEHATRYLRP